MPSVAFAGSRTLLVAEDALTQNPVRLISSVKRCITENKAEVSNADGSATRSADVVIERILREPAKRAIEERLPITAPGVTRFGCPAMWDADQRERLLGIAENAGFRVGPATLVDEPIAAGLSWIGIATQHERYFDNERVLVFDMGGGTLDVAVLDVTTNPGREPEILVLSSSGYNSAGDALDDRIAVKLEDILVNQGVDVSDLPDPSLARALLRRGASEAKIDPLDTARHRHCAGLRRRVASDPEIQCRGARGHTRTAIGPSMGASSLCQSLAVTPTGSGPH